ncbi:hypothetical protein A3K73_00375 [Candidatus Pacearchaeota archaeon RBG_13_36_9]|nr:MAG: hypothetical protein A3K73_00375 [Candidatus Pacearchaeota archaeon RBG_13_36_9]
MKKKNGAEFGESEIQILQESRELGELKYKIHELLKKLIVKTELGELEEGWADDINFDIGACTIYSCGYYSQLTLTDEDGEEHELDRDLGAVRELYRELKRRAEEFDYLIQNRSLKTAVKVFEKPFHIKLENLARK